MSQPESVIAMHKCYFCLYQLHDFKRAISVAVDHFKNCDDGDLILMVVMDIISKHVMCNGLPCLDDVQRVCVDLLKSKNLIGLQRILVRRDYDSLIARRKRVIDTCHGHLHAPVRPWSDISNGGSRLLSRWYKANLSLHRLPMVRIALKAIRQCHEASEKALKSYYMRHCKRQCGIDGTTEMVKQLEKNLTKCYRDKSLLYFQINGLIHTPTRSHGKVDGSMANPDMSLHSISPLMYCKRNTEMGQQRSNAEIYMPSNRRYGVWNSSLRNLNAQLSLADDNYVQMEKWRRYYRVVKRKIFQVCNMLFININVPFIAVDLLSRLFQNVVSTTAAGIRRCLSYVFNLFGASVLQDCSSDEENKGINAEDDVTLLFMLAANCLEIALKYHNAHARFDIFSLFYFLVFIDSILSKDDMKEGFLGMLPSLLSVVDMRVVLHQKLNCGRQYLKRSLKYHHNLFKRKLEHLSNELKKNRILEMASFRLMNCLEQLILLSHGIFGFNLTLRIAPVIIETSSSVICGTNGKRSRCDFNGHTGGSTCDCTMHATSRRGRRICNLADLVSLNGDVGMDVKLVFNPVFTRVVPKDGASSMSCESPRRFYGIGMESLGITMLMERFSTAPASELAKFNTFLTESTEISILLLHMLSCSDYIEILSGNAMFTEPGSKIVSSSLMAAIALRFVLDIFITVTDEAVAVLVGGDVNCDHSILDNTVNYEHIKAFKNYFGDYYNMIDANSCVFYLVILDIDWIFHKEGLYSADDYRSHCRLLNSIVDNEPPMKSNQAEEVFELQYRLYEKMALLMFGDKVSDRGTAACIAAFKGRSMSWNRFDEVVVRDVRPEDEICINNEIMDIYYSDVGDVRASFNPYRSIFTPKYFSVIKNLVYRVKVSLVLYYMSQRCGRVPH